MLSPLFEVVGAVATALLALGAAVGRALTPAAAAVAGAFGIVVVELAGFGFLGVLVAFVVASSAATRYRFGEKRERHVQEGRAGERGISNVLAHIVLPTGIALAAGLGALRATDAAVLFGAALAFGLADTFASEFGVLSGRAVGILTLRPVAAGTNGGVSLLGEGAALLGAFGMAGVGALSYALAASPIGSLPTFALAAGVSGFVACQVDSVLGAALENRGYLTKGSTNFLAMLSAIGFAAVLLLTVVPGA